MLTHNTATMGSGLKKNKESLRNFSSKDWGGSKLMKSCRYFFYPNDVHCRFNWHGLDVIKQNIKNMNNNKYMCQNCGACASIHVYTVIWLPSQTPSHLFQESLKKIPQIVFTFAVNDYEIATTEEKRRGAERRAPMDIHTEDRTEGT